jgi:dipeptidyl aminopeptidase/acylaminoacyl peptidase
VMPYIEGETLREKLNRETQLGIDEAVRITTEVADALDYAHRHGVIHRDIKPENILLHDGRPMVADFGIALAVSAAAGGRMTETGLSLGTPHYMSPEQATAEKELTNRSDIYSLGSVLYEMLTGDPPHTGASAQQIIMKIVTEDAAPVTKARKAVPPNVAAAVSKALEKLPADRFDSAKAFASALTNPAFTTASVAPVAARPASTRWRAALVGGLLVGAVAGGAAVRALWPTRSGARGVGTKQQLTFSGGAQRPAISPDGSLVAYIQVTCRHAQVGLCRSSLLVQEVGSTQPRVLVSEALSLDTPRWSHDGATVVVGGQLDEQRAGLFAIPRLSGTPQLIGPRGAYDTHPTADSVVVLPPPRPDSAGVALLLALGSGAIGDSIRLPPGGATDVSWGPDGRRLAMATSNGIKIVDRRGAITGTIRTSNRPCVRWSPDGTGVLFFRVGPVREDDLLWVTIGPDGRVRGEPRVVMARFPTLYRGEFDLARGTGQMVVGTGDAITDIWSFDLTARPIRGHRETRGTTWYGGPALTLDGRSLFYFQGDALGDNVYMRDRETGRDEALTAQHLPGGNAMRVSADGRRLAYSHSTDSINRIEYIEFPSRRIFGGPADIDAPAVVPLVPDGFLATLADGGRLAVLDSLGGTWRPLSIPGSLGILQFAPSPDGTTALFIATSGSTIYRMGGGFRAQSGRRGLVVGSVFLTSDATRIVTELDPYEPLPSLVWDSDGTVYIGRWRSEDELPSIWRLSLTTGAMSRVADLPAGCGTGSITIAAHGRVAACEADDFRSDIWLFDVAGLR